MNKYQVEQREHEEFADCSSQIEGEYSQEAMDDHLGAWLHLYSKDWKTLTLSMLIDCHYLLQHRLRPDIAGRLRRVNVYVGGRACPDPMLVESMLRDWFDKYADPKVFASDTPEETAEKIKQAHVEYEHIHPFEDGNGRTGRCLMNWQRVMNGLPIIIIHPGDEQYEYYTWFK